MKTVEVKQPHRPEQPLQGFYLSLGTQRKESPNLRELEGRKKIFVRLTDNLYVRNRCLRCKLLDEQLGLLVYRVLNACVPLQHLRLCDLKAKVKVCQQLHFLQEYNAREAPCHPNAKLSSAPRYLRHAQANVEGPWLNVHLLCGQVRSLFFLLVQHLNAER